MREVRGMVSKNDAVKNLGRRTILAGMGAAAAATAAPGIGRYAQAHSSKPIKIGFQVHRTGIGAAYGRWLHATVV